MTCSKNFELLRWYYIILFLLNKKKFQQLYNKLKGKEQCNTEVGTDCWAWWGPRNVWYCRHKNIHKENCSLFLSKGVSKSAVSKKVTR